MKMIGEICPCFLISDCLVLSSQQVSSSDIANIELVIDPSWNCVTWSDCLSVLSWKIIQDAYLRIGIRSRGLDSKVSEEVDKNGITTSCNFEMMCLTFYRFTVLLVSEVLICQFGLMRVFPRYAYCLTKGRYSYIYIGRWDQTLYFSIITISSMIHFDVRHIPLIWALGDFAREKKFLMIYFICSITIFYLTASKEIKSDTTADEAKALDLVYTI